MLQTALDDYEDMNPGGAVIIIHHEKPKRIPKEEEDHLF